MRLALIIFLLSLFHSTSAQVSSDNLNSPNYSVGITSDGTIEDWRVANTGQPLMYNQHLWIGGLAGSSLHHSSQMNRGTKANFFPGPVSTDPFAVNRYNRVWRVKRSQVDSLKQGLYSTLPSVIINWPAHGDTNYGEPYFLAPFVDIDGDSIYEPDHGEYPDIKGVECIYFICNDATSPQQNSNSLGIDIQGLLYRFEGGLLDSIFYVDYVITNRSNTMYTNTWLSSWADMDIGNALDDLMGTEVNSSSVFLYNGDANDEGVEGFGHELASAAMFQRSGPVADIFDGIDNERDGCIDGVRDAQGICQPENMATGVRETMLMNNSNYIYSGGSIDLSDPTSESEERSFMQGFCKSGGYKDINPNHTVWDTNIPSTTCSATGVGINSAFPGASYDTTGAGNIFPIQPIDWYESPLDKGDKKAMLSVGPFDFDIGESLNFSLGFIWHRADSASSSNDGGYSQLIGTLERVQQVTNSADTTSNGLRVTTSSKALEISSLQVHFDLNTSSWVVRSFDHDHVLELYNISGTLKEEFRLEKNSIHTVEMGNLPTGVYILIDRRFGKAYKLLR